MFKGTFYHVWLFLFGFVYYLIVPLVAVESKIWENYGGMDNLYGYYKEEYIIGYIFLVTSLCVAFLIGAFLPLFCCKNKKENDTIPCYINPRGLLVIVGPLFLYSQYVIFSNRSILFTGYTEGYDVGFLGPITTMCMLFLFLFFYNRLGRYSPKIDKLLILIILEFLVVLLGMGSRMYVLIPLLSILIFLLDIGTLSLKKVILSLVTIIVLLLIVGVWRAGGSEISLDEMVFIGIAEPSFTWITAISMYHLNDLPLFSLPYNFISSFANFIPSAIMPGKGEFVSKISLEFDAPLGATSILVSLIDNFGIVGSMFMICLLGFLLTQIRLHWLTVFGKSYYYCVCGIIPFQLFRDGMEDMNKQFFSNLIIVPSLIILTYRLMSIVLTRREK